VLSRVKVNLSALACSAAFLFCELLSRCWAEMGINDDWSYIYSALRLAETGHVHYVGWASAMVGWQLYLGAALIKLFGFSFTAPRLGTLLVGAITAYLMQRTLVRFGLTEENAVLGTLTYVFSALFLGLSATMMTDVPGLFSVVGCTYGCVRALQADRDSEAVRWIWLAVAINAICGTSRQICWLGVLVMVPSALWLLRSRRAVLLGGLVAVAAGCVFVFATLHWFNTQPYALPEPVALPALPGRARTLILRHYAKALFEIYLLIFPMTLPFLAGVRRFSGRSLACLAASVAVLAALAVHFQRASVMLLHPLQGEEIGPLWMMESTSLVFKLPYALTMPVLQLIAAMVLLSLVSLAVTLLVARPRACEALSDGAFSGSRIATLLLPFTALYLLFLSGHMVWHLWSRYVLVPTFAALVGVAVYSQRHLRTSTGWKVATWLAVANMALSGIIGNHNDFARYRARAVLAHEVLATGLPPSAIDQGWELNGWYELQVSPYINHPDIVRPAGAYHRIVDPRLGDCHQNDPFPGLFPSLAPRYGVADQPNLCDGPAPFAPVRYTSWPLGNVVTLYVVKYPPPWKAERDYEVTPTAAPVR
jgi:hypothetical protein